MKENISNTAIIYAILALNSEIILQKDYLNSPDIDNTDVNNEMDILKDMEQAFLEFIELYKLRRKSEPELPDINELLINSL